MIETVKRQLAGVSQKKCQEGTVPKISLQGQNGSRQEKGPKMIAFSCLIPHRSSSFPR